MITFVVGGTRSGKSGFALRKAATFAGRNAYIATAEALDDEMRERISAHRAQRGEEWDTFEEPLAVTEVFTKTMGMYGAILLDCLTLFILQCPVFMPAPYLNDIIQPDHRSVERLW